MGRFRQKWTLHDPFNDTQTFLNFMHTFSLSVPTHAVSVAFILSIAGIFNYRFPVAMLLGMFLKKKKTFIFKKKCCVCILIKINVLCEKCMQSCVKYNSRFVTANVHNVDVKASSLRF